MARVDGGDILVGVVLEEFLAGGRTAQRAEHSELAKVDVGDSGAVVLPVGQGMERHNVGEKDAGELGMELLVPGHEILLPNRTGRQRLLAFRRLYFGPLDGSEGFSPAVSRRPQAPPDGHVDPSHSKKPPKVFHTDPVMKRGQSP